MPQIQAGETFAVGQQFTATRANNHVGGAILLNGAVTEQVVPGTAITATDTVLLTHSTLRGRLEKVSVNEIFASAVNINATGNITAGGKIEGNSLSVKSQTAFIGHGLFYFEDPLNPGIGANIDINLDQKLEVTTGWFTLQSNSSMGGTINALGGPLVIQSNWVNPSSPTGNILVYGDLDITNAATVINNGVDCKSRIVDPVVYEVEYELKDNFKCQRGVDGVVNVSVANFTTSAPTLFTETFSVPAGEKWVIDFDMSFLGTGGSDTFYFGWFVDGTIQQYHVSQGLNSWNNKSCSFTLTIDNSSGTTTMTKVASFRGAPRDGSGNDYCIFGDLRALPDHPYSYWEEALSIPYFNYYDLCLDSKWKRTITKTF